MTDTESEMPTIEEYGPDAVIHRPEEDTELALEYEEDPAANTAVVTDNKGVTDNKNESNRATIAVSGSSGQGQAAKNSQASQVAKDKRFNEPCRYFKYGTCMRGKACFYIHDVKNQIEKPAPAKNAKSRY